MLWLEWKMCPDSVVQKSLRVMSMFGYQPEGTVLALGVAPAAVAALKAPARPAPAEEDKQAKKPSDVVETLPEVEDLFAVKERKFPFMEALGEVGMADVSRFARAIARDLKGRAGRPGVNA